MSRRLAILMPAIDRTCRPAVNCNLTLDIWRHAVQFRPNLKVYKQALLR